jgi:hypothetical protein
MYKAYRRRHKTIYIVQDDIYIAYIRICEEVDTIGELKKIWEFELLKQETAVDEGHLEPSEKDPKAMVRVFGGIPQPKELSLEDADHLEIAQAFCKKMGWEAPRTDTESAGYTYVAPDGTKYDVSRYGSSSELEKFLKAHCGVSVEERPKITKLNTNSYSDDAFALNFGEHIDLRTDRRQIVLSSPIPLKDGGINKERLKELDAMVKAYFDEVVQHIAKKLLTTDDITKVHHKASARVHFSGSGGYSVPDEDMEVLCVCPLSNE